MNAIGFSLYGSVPKYCIGAVENARIASQFYPGWELHLWYSRDVPASTLNALGELGVNTHEAPKEIENGMFWRHLVHDLNGVERYVIRDVDSRFSERELKSVSSWIESKCVLHVMRDHPYHNQAIMGGMWGWNKQENDFSMFDLLKLWPSKQEGYGGDQRFVKAAMWERTSSKFIHDSCGTFDGLNNWPSDGRGFVGEYVDEEGKFNEEHRQLRMDHMSTLKQ